ncbi:carboxypeptidase-like regulatory domain-containing protein, partial [Streptococcus acidominimus]|nr:carboxypeptidase-like regulatory domain-containing protein [Streptococcus acidominimus]
DIDGKYSLTVNDASKDILVFSYIGMDNQEIPVKGRKQIDVTLRAGAIMMEETVVIGYAPMKRKEMTGSMSSVKSDELLKVPTSD